MEKTKKNQAEAWEIRDRVYVLRNNKSPLTLTIPSKHTRKHSLLYFDPQSGKQRELRYATNQPTPFVDEQKGETTMGHIIFKDGTLVVPKNNQSLQKLLSLYHPLKGKIYNEYNKAEEAKDELEILNLQIEALNAAKEMEVDHAEAVLRTELGSKVSDMSSKEIKRDLMLFAKSSSKLFLDLANDENVQLRNFAVKATELNIVKLSDDQRYFKWASNGRKLMEVPVSYTQSPSPRDGLLSRMPSSA